MTDLELMVKAVAESVGQSYELIDYYTFDRRYRIPGRPGRREMALKSMIVGWNGIFIFGPKLSTFYPWEEMDKAVENWGRI